jgi:CBS domain-containing protein
MEHLLKLARRPAVTVAPNLTVRQLAKILMIERIGAAVVLDEGVLVGIVSERDVVGRCVAEGRDPDLTRACEIMTLEVRTTRDAVTVDRVAELMHEGRFRHMPVVDAEGHVEGMLSILHVLRRRVARLDLEKDELLNYISVDGPGG